MKIHNSLALLRILLISPYFYSTAPALGAAPTVGSMVLKSTHIIVTGRNVNERSPWPESTYVLAQSKIKYLCTARDVGLCPNIFGGMWVKTDNEQLADPQSYDEKFKLYKGSLEFTCLTFVSASCPLALKGSWKRDDTWRKDTNPTKRRVLGSDIFRPVVTCYSRVDNICKELDPGNSWDIKKHSQVRYGVRGWMRNIQGAELHCKSLDVHNCPLNDGGWVQVNPSTMKPKKRPKYESILDFGIDLEDSPSKIIQNYRARKKMHVVDKTVGQEKKYEGDAQMKVYSENDIGSVIFRNLNGQGSENFENAKEDQGHNSENTNDGFNIWKWLLQKNDCVGNGNPVSEHLDESGNEGQERVGDVERNSNSKNYTHPPHLGSQLNKAAKLQSEGSASSRQPETTTIFTEVMDKIKREWTTRFLQNKDWVGTENPTKGNLSKNGNENQKPVSEGGIYSDSNDRLSQSGSHVLNTSKPDELLRKSSASSEKPESTTILAKAKDKKIKAWIVRIGKAEMICRAEHESDCPKIRKIGRKAFVKWQKSMI